MNTLIECRERRVSELCVQIAEMPLTSADGTLGARLQLKYQEIQELRGLEESQWIDLDRAHNHLVRRLSEHIQKASTDKPARILDVQARLYARLLSKLPRFGAFDGSNLPIFTDTQDDLIESVAKAWGLTKSKSHALRLLHVIDHELKRAETASLPKKLLGFIGSSASKERLEVALDNVDRKLMSFRTRHFVKGLMEKVAA